MGSLDSSDTISLGDYIIIQRQKYTKLHKFNSLDSTAMLGKELLELRNIASQPYSTTFKMVSKDGAKGRRTSTLDLCTDKSYLTMNITAKDRGIDNRNITDDGLSQSLTPEDIQKLREDCSSSTEIVTQIVENSKTFTSKTEYSQEKYLKKKEKKYFEFVQIKRPNIRMIADIMYRQSAEKIYGLRMDTLSQLISYSGVCGVGNYLLYESGTNGLVPAALLNSIGCNTKGKLVHMHPGNVPQKQALLALNLKREQLDRCISVNIYSILRQYYQGDEIVSVLGSGIHKRNSDDVDPSNGTPSKIRKLNENDENARDLVVEDTKTLSEAPNTTKEQWVIDNQHASDILKHQVDGLIICAKEHPSSLVKSLLPFVKPSRPIVVYNLTREILTDLYVEMKATYSVTNLKITSNWMRSYQILPNRTHPEINMSGNSGFLLTGYTVRLDAGYGIDINNVLIELAKKGLMEEMELIGVYVDNNFMDILKLFDKLQLLDVECSNVWKLNSSIAWPRNIKQLRLILFRITHDVFISMIQQIKSLGSIDLHNCAVAKRDRAPFKDVTKVSRDILNIIDYGSKQQRLDVVWPNDMFKADPMNKVPCSVMKFLPNKISMKHVNIFNQIHCLDVVEGKYSELEQIIYRYPALLIDQIRKQQ